MHKHCEMKNTYFKKFKNQREKRMKVFSGRHESKGCSADMMSLSDIFECTCTFLWRLSFPCKSEPYVPDEK